MITLSERAQQFSDSTLGKVIDNHVASRISEKDHTLWGPEASDEAKIRLNWVDAAEQIGSILLQVQQIVEQIASLKDPKVVLCGMGGSSLGPEVIGKAFGLNLVALDATDPDQVQKELVSLENVWVVNSSKSGSTVETDSHRRIFEKAFTSAGIDPKERIIFVTDPGSPLSEDAASQGYRHIVHADPNIGGRFSVLTAFGIVPTVLLGAPVNDIGDQAVALSHKLFHDSPNNPAILLATALASNVPTVNKVVIAEDPANRVGLGDWIEQLIAESTGKEDTGLLPVIVDETSPEITSPEQFPDCITVWLGSKNSAIRAGISPDIICDFSLGEHFLLWEYATAIMGYLLGIDPFNQPDVEAAKQAARQLLTASNTESIQESVDRESSEAQKSAILNVAAIENLTGSPDSADSGTLTAEEALSLLLNSASTTSYVSIHTYLDRSSNADFLELRNLLATRTTRPTTFGWGPRFLHSTGQFHKGGPKEGIFLQLVHTGSEDLSIPGRDFTFQELMLAQANGDRHVLASLGRPVVTLEFSDPAAALSELKRIISKGE